MTNYYEVLEVTQTASKDEIKSAFRKKARQLHPDVNKAKDAEERFKELGRAYETLIDDEKRTLYDRYGEDGLQNAGYTSQGPFDGGFGDLSDIFESFFGGMGGFSGFSGFSGRRQNPNAPQKGSDLRLDIELTFKDAVFGLEKEIKIHHLENCAECGGSGAKPGTKPETCPKCGGSGHVQQVTNTILGSFSQISTCPTCNGKGVYNTNPCSKCSGNGVLEVEKTLNIKIPAGVDDGSKIRISAEGDVGQNGGPSGDLYVVLHVREDKKFKREGYNIFTELNVDFAQAALGDVVEIETIDSTVKLTLPTGVAHDTVLPIKNAGVQYINGSQRGDHFVIVKLKTPKNLTQEQKQLYAKLYELTQGKPHNGQQSFVDKVKSVLHN